MSTKIMLLLFIICNCIPVHCMLSTLQLVFTLRKFTCISSSQESAEKELLVWGLAATFPCFSSSLPLFSLHWASAMDTVLRTADTVMNKLCISTMWSGKVLLSNSILGCESPRETGWRIRPGSYSSGWDGQKWPSCILRGNLGEKNDENSSEADRRFSIDVAYGVIA